MSVAGEDGGTLPPKDNSSRLAGLQARSREGAAGRTVGYSKFVGFMRYALPLGAILLLGLVIVWPLATGRLMSVHRPSITRH